MANAAGSENFTRIRRIFNVQGKAKCDKMLIDGGGSCQVSVARPETLLRTGG
jgi:hypothetical protein